MRIAADKVEIGGSEGEGRFDGGEDVFPPLLDVFGIVNPGAGQKAKAKIFGCLFDGVEAGEGIGAESGLEIGVN